MEHADHKVSANDSVSNDKTNDSCDIIIIEEKREARQLRNWAIKVLILSMAAIIVPTTLVIVWIYLVRAPSAEGADIIKTFITTISELIKFMFTE